MNSRTIRVAMLCGCALLTVAAPGCTAIKGTTEKWSTAWKERSKPKPVDPNHEEVVTYWGQKKKPAKQVEMPAELKAKMAKNTEDAQRSREYVDNFKEGNAKLKENRLDEARRAYELALTAKPDDPDTHHRLAVVADKQRMFGLADDHYEAALRQRPRDPNLLSDLGYSYSLRGNDQQAEKTLQQALSFNPAHKGAMANLGTLYARQGRHDEALAVFRRGATETETQQYMAQLFPQGKPAQAAPGGTAFDGMALAQQSPNTGSRQAPPMPSENSVDLRGMNVEQLKAEMERRRLQGVQARQQQQMAELAQARDWSNDTTANGQPAGSSLNSQPWNAGAHANPQGTASPASQVQILPHSQNSSPNVQTIPLPGTHQPGVQNVPFSSGSSGFNGNNGAASAQSNGFATAQSAGSLTAPRGTNPLNSMETWQGAPVQPNNFTPGTTAAQTASTAPWNQPLSFGPPPSAPGSALGVRLDQIPGLQPGLTPGQSTGIEQTGYSQGSSASQAAAQLAMGAGPGSMFPIVAGDGAASGTSASAPTNTTSRFGAEFSQPPQYQSPGSQYSPSSSLPSFNPSGFSGETQNWQNTPSGTPSAALQQNSGRNEPSLVPASPASNMARAWDNAPNPSQWGTGGGSGVVQAGGSSGWDQTSSRSGDALDAFAGGSTNGTSRYARSPWGESSAPATGSQPYNGAWPNSNNSSATGTTAAPQALPVWNGGTAAAASSNASPPQWPYSPQR